MELIQTTHFKRDYKKLPASIQKRTDEKLKFLVQMYLTLREALEKKLLKVKEVDEGGSVPELRVINKARVSVLLLDGEELVGAKQNRWPSGMRLKIYLNVLRAAQPPEQ